MVTTRRVHTSVGRLRVGMQPLPENVSWCYEIARATCERYYHVGTQRRRPCVWDPTLGRCRASAAASIGEGTVLASETGRMNASRPRKSQHRLHSLGAKAPQPPSPRHVDPVHMQLHGGNTCCSWVEETKRVSKRARCGDVDTTDAYWMNPFHLTGAGKLGLRIVMNHGSAGTKTSCLSHCKNLARLNPTIPASSQCAGFFAYMLFAINQIIFARSIGAVPFVDFGACTVNGHDHYASGGRNLYFEPQHGPNTWEYFFEQLSHKGWPSRSTLQVHTLSSKALWRLHHESRASVFAYYYGRYAAKRHDGYVRVTPMQTPSHHAALQSMLNLTPIYLG